MPIFLALLYGGPDTLMPIASALAAIIGVLLMLWNRVVLYAHKFIQLVSRRSPKTPYTNPPKRKTARRGA